MNGQTGKRSRLASHTVTYVRKMLLQRLGQIFSMLLRDVDSDFSHYFDCQRISIRGLLRRAYSSEFVAGGCIQKALRYLAARRVAGREEKNLGFVNHCALPESHGLYVSPYEYVINRVRHNQAIPVCGPKSTAIPADAPANGASPTAKCLLANVLTPERARC